MYVYFVLFIQGVVLIDMVQVVNYIVPVTLMVMAIVQLEVTGVNVTLDGQDGVVIKIVPKENMDMIAQKSKN